ncbi:cytochrome P450 [Amycolatopsis sp. NPDC098790]|uniref:cytochrome P450 n=1 Tax=Amycolatopsis sp. NPDC098790 TaxID=3363939 RepID=UPI00381E143A
MTATHDVPLRFPFGEEEALTLNPAYAAIRDTPGLTRVRMPYGAPAWLVARYADARFVLGDRRFVPAAADNADEPRMAEYHRSGGILMSSPENHARLRGLVAKAFTMRRVEGLRPRVAELAGGLIDGMRAGGEPADLVAGYALPIPVAVICEFLGVPAGDRERFRGWTEAVTALGGLTAAEYERNFTELREYTAALIADHRATPRDDLMTALIEARDVGDKLTEPELVELCISILVAGHDTSVSQIANFVYALLDQPGAWQRLVAEPGLVPAAVEELMRFIPLIATASFPRYPTEDVTVGDVLVRAGEPVLVAVGAANRDGLRFGSPDELVFDRPANHHLGFGHGAHHCLGAALARLELQEALAALVRELPGLRLAGDPAWKSEMLIRGPGSMPVAW